MVYESFPAFKEWQVDYDPTLVEEYSKQLEELKQISTPAELDAALTTTLRYAAVDTGALEGLYTTDRGFTRTVATQASAWEQAAKEKGPHVKETIEDAIAGYELVLDAVTESKYPHISESWIRSLHEVLLASQETYRVWVPSIGSIQDRPLPKGQYKTDPNNPTNRSTGEIFNYAPPSDTPMEMARLIAELRSPEFLEAHPVIQAAYAHYAFVRIHPFADGNGRVARALASVYLYRSPKVPLVIFADQRAEYLDALEAADQRSYDQFTQFISERVIDTVNMIRQSLSLSDSLDEDTSAIANALSSGRSSEVENATKRLQELAVQSLREAFTSIDLPVEIKIKVNVFDSMDYFDRLTPEGYFLANDDLCIRVTLKDNPVLPPRASNQRDIFALVNARTSLQPEILIIPLAEENPRFEAFLREIDPVVTKSLQLRLEMWSKTVAGNFIKKISQILSE